MSNSIYIKNILSGPGFSWVIMDSMIVKQSFAVTPEQLQAELKSGLKNCITWESYLMPEEFCRDLKSYYLNNKDLLPQ